MFAPKADGHRRQRGLKEDAIRYSNADAKAAGFTAGLRADDECSPSTKRNKEMQDGWPRMKCPTLPGAFFFSLSASPKRHVKLFWIPTYGGGLIYHPQPHLYAPAMRNLKLPLVKLADGHTYEGEWLNGKKHGRGIYTWADGDR